MHFQIADKTLVSSLKNWFIPLEFIVFDDFAFLLIFGIFTWWRKKLTYIITFSIITIWSFVNVIYSRYFHQYLPIDAIKESSNFNGLWWIEYLFNALKFSDIIYAISTLAFVFLVSKAPKCKMNFKLYLLIPIIIIVFHSITFPIIFKCSFNNYLQTNYGKLYLNEMNYNPQSGILYSGLFRSQIYCNLLKQNSKNNYTESDIKSVDLFIENSKKNKSNFFENQNKNIVFILVESYLSVSSDMIINGFEITPNLNRLKNSDSCYFNKNMHSNIEKGESSDGQFIYLSGLLPLKNDITVSKVIFRELESFPKYLRDSLNYNTNITIPTRSSFWHQDQMNIKYGISNCYSTITNSKQEAISSDKNVFDLALEKEIQMREPYFHLILTSSMHGMYNELHNGVTNYNIDFPNYYSNEFKNYLNTCHYTDSLIGNYISKIKENNKYNNTIIIIASDHEAHQNLLKMDSLKLDNLKIPLYILNANIDKTQAVSTDINQIDLFPTILDLINSNYEFRGIGQSILKAENYNFDISTEKRKVSEIIIQTDYFKKKE